jgi:hypothetical protein
LALLQRGYLLIVAGRASPASRLSEGHPDKWEVVSNQSIDDFVTNGFELNSMAYDWPQSNPRHVH